MTEGEMVGQHHRLNGYEFEQTRGDSEGQESLACCNQCSCKKLDTTQQLNDNDSVTVIIAADEVVSN